MTSKAFAALLLLAGTACASTKEGTMVREPAVAGQFYPSDAKTLTARVDSMLGSAEAPAVEPCTL